MAAQAFGKVRRVVGDRDQSDVAADARERIAHLGDVYGVRLRPRHRDIVDVPKRGQAAHGRTLAAEAARGRRKRRKPTRRKKPRMSSTGPFGRAFSPANAAGGVVKSAAVGAQAKSNTPAQRAGSRTPMPNT